MRRKSQKVAEIIKNLPADEKRAVKSAIGRVIGRRTITEAKAIDCITMTVTARARTEARRKSDRASDPGRRLTVSARVPRAQAERYKAAAREEGLSLYAWVVNALNTALKTE